MNRIVIVAGATLALAACGADVPEHEAREMEPAAVTVTDAWTATSRASHPARVVHLQEAQVATRMAGTIVRIPVNVGDRVTRGALIAALDASDVQARIAGAQAQLELAQRTWTRVENLERDGAASTHEKDQALAQLRAAEAMLQEAEAHAAYVEIRAPFTGVVTARMADAGNLAAPGQPLVQLSGTGVKVVAELPADLAGSVEVGQTVRLDTDRAAMNGQVANVVPALNRATRRFQIEVTPESPGALVPGSFVRMHLEGGNDETRWIPADAIFRLGQLTGVYAVESDTLRLRWLRLGRTLDGAVEVLGGPAGDLTVVRNPGGELSDGQPVSGVTAAPAPSPASATQEG